MEVPDHRFFGTDYRFFFFFFLKLTNQKYVQNCMGFPPLLHSTKITMYLIEYVKLILSFISLQKKIQEYSLWKET